jgi:hypothetical protein
MRSPARAVLCLAAALAEVLVAGCAARNELRYDLSDPGLAADTDRTKVYPQPPDRMLAAARKALSDRGFSVGESCRSRRGTWFVAMQGSSAVGIDTSTGIGVLVAPTAEGNARVSVVSRTADTPKEIHVWIANGLSPGGR